MHIRVLWHTVHDTSPCKLCKTEFAHTVCGISELDLLCPHHFESATKQAITRQKLLHLMKFCPILPIAYIADIRRKKHTNLKYMVRFSTPEVPFPENWLICILRR